MILSHALQRSVSNTMDTAVHVLCVLLFLPNNFIIIIRVLKIAPATGAITGYHKVFATCKLLERSEKNGQLKKLSNKKKKKLLKSWPICSFLKRTLSTWGTHIPCDMCSPAQDTHIPSDMCSPTWETCISSNKCFPTRELHFPRDMHSSTWETHLPSDMSSPTKKTYP